MDTTVDLDTFSSLVERPDEGARRGAEERWQQLAMPRDGLGRLQELGAWLASARGERELRPLTSTRVLLFAADHGVAALGVSTLEPRGGTADRVRAVLDGTAPVAVLARRYGADVRVVDIAVDADPNEFPEDVVRHRVRRGSGRIDVEDALTADETARAFRTGMAIADEEADAGTDLVLLGDLGVGATTVAAVLIGALCGTDAAAVTGRGSGVDDRTWMVKCATVRDALRRARPVLGDQLALLGATGGADFAAITGFLLQAAVRKLPVVLDGVVSAACALVAQRIAFRSPEWWRAAALTGEPAQAKAYDRLTLTPLHETGVTMGEGVSAVLALPLLQAAGDTLAEPAAVPHAKPLPPRVPAKLPTAADLLDRY
ncbi:MULTISPECIES: nicotinate-nucleotide--dimethylbenzimidazole phosphoribosyltransferase [Kitasatospora]|uniref:Nicotinate-nucleotide--dimethylbenzimidazole phosphoribosyltransferase n=1 Tax=Kitasatospora setae (strain ATCC 33774 / DSM 43861 / JCM 3304 / KCC A-0304 / NBRC 14216 / KM-6054) TaxID=452652 RepID=E4NA04_KITSK|nr:MULTISPECIES: nicotinate-nucleotide--dimethylbenzimidazole phosphoribosyltransferase [Kitasatospora]BAJ28035.1 putative nicotinate-nucleotide--dimethylbenzimidazole phosphoribosyltransferase [Kitasatospora setae KM-6054]